MEDVQISAKMNQENSRNEENRQNGANDVLNKQPQQQVPVQHTTVLDNKLGHEDEKLSENKNGDHSESTSSQTALQARNSANEKKANVSSPQKTVISKSVVASSETSDQPQSTMKESCKKEKNLKGKARLSDWEGKKFTIECLEGHNDLISSVDMDGWVLISGRFV